MRIIAQKHIHTNISPSKYAESKTEQSQPTIKENSKLNLIRRINISRQRKQKTEPNMEMQKTEHTTSKDLLKK